MNLLPIELAASVQNRLRSSTNRLLLPGSSTWLSDASTRAIDPHSLVFAEQMWYVVASTGDTTLRIFRLDRVEAVAVLDETFERDPSAGLRVQEAGRAFVSGTARHMTVRYSPRIARWVAEREQVPLDADGSLTLEHPVADDSWAERHVLQYGPDAEVLAPDAMRALVAERLREVTARATG